MPVPFVLMLWPCASGVSAIFLLPASPGHSERRGCWRGWDVIDAGFSVTRDHPLGGLLLGSLRQRLPDQRDAVDEHDDEITGRGQVDAGVGGRDLVGHGVDAIRGQAGIEHGLPQQGGHLAASPAARIVILADDDLVEGLTCQQAEGTGIFVAAVSGNSDDADAAWRRRARDEVADGLQSGDVMGVVHHDLPSGDVEQVEAARAFAQSRW